MPVDGLREKQVEVEEGGVKKDKWGRQQCEYDGGGQSILVETGESANEEEGERG